MSRVIAILFASFQSLLLACQVHAAPALPAATAPDWRSEGFVAAPAPNAGAARFGLRAPQADIAVRADGSLVFALRAANGERRSFEVHVEGFGGWSEPEGAQRLPDSVQLLTEAGPTPVARFAELGMRARDGGVQYRLRRNQAGSAEQLFVVAPGVDASRLALRFERVNGIARRSDGGLSLALALAGEALAWSAPMAWQYGPDEAIEPVRVRYRIEGHRVAFDFGRYDRKRALHVDPYLARSYHGGTADEFATEDLVMQADGSLLVAGQSNSVDLPGVGGSSPSGRFSYVTRFSADLSQRLGTLLFPHDASGGFIGFPLKLALHGPSGDVFVAASGGTGAYPLRLWRFSSDLTAQLASRTIPTNHMDNAPLQALAVSSVDASVYIASGYAASNEYLRPLRTRLVRLPITLASIEDERIVPNLVVNGLTVSTQSPGHVFAAFHHATDGGWYGEAAPSFGAGRGVLIREFSPDLQTSYADRTLVAPTGTLDAVRLRYDASRAAILMIGDTNSPDLPQGSSPGAETELRGFRDLFLASFKTASGHESLTYLGGFGKDGAVDFVVHDDGLRVLGTACFDNTGVAAGDRHWLPGVDGGILPLRPRSDRTCSSFLTLLDNDLGAIRRSTWLADAATAAAETWRSGLALSEGQNGLATAGRVELGGNCGGGLVDGGFSLAGAVQPQAAGGCSEAFVETLTRDIAAAVTLPGGHCGNTVTTNCGAAIPDNPFFNNWLDSNRTVLGCGYVRGLRVGVDIAHTWVGDLTVTLHAPDGSTRVLLDRPGVPGSAAGCGDEHVRAVFDDRADAEAENVCAASPPASHAILGTFLPAQALAGLIGKAADGAWRLRVVDSASGDAGTLQDWSLELDCSPTPIANADLEASFVSLTAPGVANAIVPGMPFSWTARVRNLGPSAITGARLESDLRGGFSNVSFTCLPVSGAACVTPSGSGGLVQADLNLGVNAIAEVTITATPNATMDSPLIGGYADVYRPAALGATGIDANAANNRVQWIAPVLRVADLRVAAMDPPPAASPNGTTAFQFVVVDDGPSRVTEGLVRIAPLEKLAVESVVCVSAGSAVASAAVHNDPYTDLDVLVSPENEGFLVCDVVVRISSLAQPGDTARIAFSVGGSGYTETQVANNSHEHAITVVAPSPEIFKDHFE